VGGVGADGGAGDIHAQRRNVQCLIMGVICGTLFWDISKSDVTQQGSRFGSFFLVGIVLLPGQIPAVRPAWSSVRARRGVECRSDRADASMRRKRESGPGGLTRETPLPSNSPHDHMILRVDLVGSHGRWKRPQPTPECDDKLNNIPLRCYTMLEPSGRVETPASPVNPLSSGERSVDVAFPLRPYGVPFDR
jgi:hypothetical protein